MSMYSTAVYGIWQYNPGKYLVSHLHANRMPYLATILAPSVDWVSRTILTASSGFCRWSRLILHISNNIINSLWRSDTIWRHRSGSTLAQVMAWCRHWIQWWLITSKTLIQHTVETLYNTVNFCWNTHKRHSTARPKGRGMGCLLWVQRATYCVDLSKLSSIKYLL